MPPILLITTMDEGMNVSIDPAQTSQPVDWLTVIGATSGMAVRVQFMPDQSKQHPTILQALSTMVADGPELAGLIAYEGGAVIVWHEYSDPVAIPNHEGSRRTQ